MIRVFCISLILLAAAAVLSAGQEPGRNKFINTDDGKLLAWIFFKDKGPSDQLQLSKASQILSERAVERRRKLDRQMILEYSDYPVFPEYINTLESYGVKRRTASRWLNAVSAEIRPEFLDTVQGLEFVENVKPLMRYVRDEPKLQTETEMISSFDNLAESAADTFDYGRSYPQISMINVHKLHQRGITGEGVLICILDNGFNLLDYHITFDSVKVISTWDFINDDESVDDTEFAATEGDHGTRVLGVIAGYTPGTLIGPAYQSSYLLGKTEVDGSETPVEEDYWVEGIEWAESMGADILTSSVGYDGWYSWDDMDGETAVTTIAADIAAEKGLIVFNSAGNEYDSIENNTLIAPADGKKVLAVASVKADGLRSSFSSVGPSADGRIKPDLAAMGSYVWTASYTDSAGFIFANGTSFSTPLAAGAAALLLSKIPDAKPGQLRQALKMTASRAKSPDKYLGWGIIDAEAALKYLDSLQKTIPTEPEPVDEYFLFQNYPNPFNPKTTIKYTVERNSFAELKIFDISGREVYSVRPKIRESGQEYEEIINLSSHASGMYIYQLIIKEFNSGRKRVKSKRMLLLK